MKIITSRELNVMINKIHEEKDLKVHISKKMLTKNKNGNIRDEFHHKNDDIHDIHDENDINELMYIEQPLIEDFNCSGRPSGLYYGIGNSWLDLILNDRDVNKIYEPCCFLYVLEIDETNIRHINSIESILEFDKEIPNYYLHNEKYNMCGTWNFNPTKSIPYKTMIDNKGKYDNMFEFYYSIGAVFKTREEFMNKMKTYYIDIPESMEYSHRRKRWDLVAKKYSGIEITDFINFDKKNKIPHWYPTFSVASGCVWDPKAIKSLRLMAKMHEKHKSDRNKDKWLIL